ncbi:polymeric immunoglobulin receptor-like isoform X1 [Channa argus]|uniref:polymeric immunoglobulin receptor-like isoform X1 n=1 Tax=Channa argus TaxID=215402 RepID=UPI00294402A9|nr:hypothetical protein Q8A73_003627 [Channa argus]
MCCLQILLFILSIALSCLTSAEELIHVFGYEKKEAKVPCSYGTGYESYNKYLCRNDCNDEDVLVTTPEMNSKYSISDDKLNRVFTTTISHLSYADAGKYWCGVSRTGKDIYTEVKLEVVRDSCCDSSTTVQSYEGGSVSISCPYDSRYQSNLKYICRGNQPSTCRQQAAVTSDNKRNRQFSLTDHRSTSFTVTITSVTQKDSGLYLCGVQRNTGLDVFSAVVLEVKENRCCDSSTTVQSYEGGSVTISCLYESQYQSNLKYICRGNQPSTCWQQAAVTSNNKRNRQFSLTDDRSRSFTVTITSVTQKDSGSYLCGVQRNPGLDVFSAVVLEVKENRCCNNSTKVQSYEGGSVSVSCPYESQYQSNLKYICRGNQPSTCWQQAAVTSNNKRNRQFSLTDDRSRSFTVTITSVTQKDSGSYLCGVQRNPGLDVFSAVVLEVKENRCCNNSTKVQSYEGGSVSISCPYESQYQSNLKYICRGNQPSTCWQQAAVTSNNRQNGHFNLTDDKSRSFTVTITSVTQKDSGSYLCGVQRSTGLDVFSAVVLEVKEWCCVKSNQLSGTVGRPLTMQCPYPPQHETNRKFLCKGDSHRNCKDMVMSSSSSNQTEHRFTLQDDISSRSFSVTIKELKAEDAGTYWCVSDSQRGAGNYNKIQLSVDVASFQSVVFIAPAVALPILIIVLVLVCKYKCQKVQGNAVELPRTTTKAADAEEVMGEADIYVNHDIAMSSKQRTSKQETETCPQYDDAEDDNDYQNFNISEDIYCNEFHSTGYRR